jgi:hypothetical protein
VSFDVCVNHRLGPILSAALADANITTVEAAVELTIASECPLSMPHLFRRLHELGLEVGEIRALRPPPVASLDERGLHDASGDGFGGDEVLD